MSDILQELKKISADYSLLYIEDNEGLRTNLAKLLNKFFKDIHTAENGKIGFDMFKKYHPDIIITDINMPEMNGLEMAQKIHDISPSSKMIIMSAYDEKEYLHQAINVGIFRYLNKPAKTEALMQTLYEALLVIQKEEDNMLLHVQMQDIFNYQNNIIIMLKNKVPILVNHRFLDFFDVERIEDFLSMGRSFDSLLLEHNNFLSSTETKPWYDEACTNPGKLFHAKIMNHQNENRHLILKSRKIPKKEDHYVLSFDDVTELNLMGLFDKDSTESDMVVLSNQTVLKMIKIVQDNSAEIKVHNFYRGLTITHPAVITDSDDKKTTIKTSYSQLKIVQLIKNTVITSEIFPKPILIKSVDKIDFDEQTITFSNMMFLTRSALERKNIRLEPDEDHQISVFYNNRKFTTKCRVVDISITSVKIEVGMLPPGVEKNAVLKLVIFLPTGGIPLIINTDANLLRIDEHSKSFDLIVLFELNAIVLKRLITYMANRQKALIREFKSLELRS